MKLFLIISMLIIQTYASILELNSFEADFTQSITDEKENTIKYKGHLKASKPQNALWSYTFPIEKSIFINKLEATIVEPEIEQVIIRRFHSEFDFFHMIKSAKKIAKDKYIATYNNIKYIINVSKNTVNSISYSDQFENKVKIKFSNQKQNHKIDKKSFIPKYSSDFDIIND